MKLHASRDERDLNDAAVLFNRLGYISAQDCIDLLTATYPTAQLMPRHRYIAEDIAARAHARTDTPDPKLPKCRSASGLDDGLDPLHGPCQQHPGRGPQGPGRSL